MKGLEIKVEGSGTLDQLAVRLIELGRKLQIANVYNTEVDLSDFEDNGCLTAEIKEEA